MLRPYQIPQEKQHRRCSSISNPQRWILVTTIGICGLMFAGSNYRSFQEEGILLMITDQFGETSRSMKATTHNDRFGAAIENFVIGNDQGERIVPTGSTTSEFCLSLLHPELLDNKVASFQAFNEHVEVCQSENTTHSSMMQILSSSLLDGYLASSSYTHGCRQTPLSKKGHKTLQQIFPDVEFEPNLHFLKHSAMQERCQNCIASTTQGREGSFHHCLIWPEDKHVIVSRNVQTVKGLRGERLVFPAVPTPDESIPLSAIHKQLKQRLLFAANSVKDFIVRVPDDEDKTGIIIYLDSTSKGIDKRVYPSFFFNNVTSISIVSHRSCMSDEIETVFGAKQRCSEYAHDLVRYFEYVYPGLTGHIRFKTISSTAEIFARLLAAKRVVCPPLTPNCLLVGLAKQAAPQDTDIYFLESSMNDPAVEFFGSMGVGKYGRTKVEVLDADQVNLHPDIAPEERILNSDELSEDSSPTNTGSICTTEPSARAVIAIVVPPSASITAGLVPGITFSDWNMLAVNQIVDQVHIWDFRVTDTQPSTPSWPGMEILHNYGLALNSECSVPECVVHQYYSASFQKEYEVVVFIPYSVTFFDSRRLLDFIEHIRFGGQVPWFGLQASEPTAILEDELFHKRNTVRPYNSRYMFDGSAILGYHSTIASEIALRSTTRSMKAMREENSTIAEKYTEVLDLGLTYYISGVEEDQTGMSTVHPSHIEDYGGTPSSFLQHERTHPMVILVVQATRQSIMELQLPYIEESLELGVIDEVHFWDFACKTCNIFNRRWLQHKVTKENRKAFVVPLQNRCDWSESFSFYADKVLYDDVILHMDHEVVFFDPSRLQGFVDTIRGEPSVPVWGANVVGKENIAKQQESNLRRGYGQVEKSPAGEEGERYMEHHHFLSDPKSWFKKPKHMIAEVPESSLSFIGYLGQHTSTATSLKKKSRTILDEEMKVYVPMVVSDAAHNNETVTDILINMYREHTPIRNPIPDLNEDNKNDLMKLVGSLLSQSQHHSLTAISNKAER